VSKTVIAVRGLGKRYRLGTIGRNTLQDELGYWWQRVRGRDPHQHLLGASGQVAPRVGDFWALKDVSFDVRRGEVVGVIGSNGAGKSTLLKILSRITTPTEGEALLQGRLRALLEVGTGFHPDLTGRENIYLNGAIMGMTRSEIDSRLESIVAFSEIGQFMDTPVKRYSSGMYVRLAFAVAAHLEPEIFIIDEVLAVGDVSFQEKCLGKIGEIVHAGRTVLFVSHNMGAIRKLCSRALWLDAGRVARFGDTTEVVDAYLTGQASREGEFRPARDSDSWQAAHMVLKRVTLCNEEGEPMASFANSGRAYLEIGHEVVQSTARTRVGFRIATQDGTVVFTSVDTDPDGRGTSREAGRYVSRCEMPLGLLNAGRYQVTVFADRRMGREPLFEFMNVLSFVVHVVSGVGSMGGESRQGVVLANCPWRILEVA
jgi:lipopolysaccharide transport system ATP-binding protein